ncbi:MAG: polysaccharide deacetylase family protein [Butyrivibrio sp.]|nr:polysaccharide deacetylase family protein [Butyrivibrio sp.]
MMGKKIALTFDDGPSTVTTPQVLDKLKKYNVIASFFLVADNINEESEKIVKACITHGCEICNHSKTHSFMTKLSVDEIKAEIKYTDEAIEKLTGYKPRFFRPPYIDVKSEMYECIDLPFICGIHGTDWEDDVLAQQRADMILSQARDGAIILMHDYTGNNETVKALDIVIPALLEQGYEFVNITDLFKLGNVEPAVHSGIIYSNIYDTEPYSG